MFSCASSARIHRSGLQARTLFYSAMQQPGTGHVTIIQPIASGHFLLATTTEGAGHP
jgi:hypothetical protein